MTEPTIAEPITAPPRMGFVQMPVSKAILTLQGVSEGQAAWEELVDNEIHLVQSGVDRQDAATFKKVLLDQSSMRTLLIIWKESPHVSETELTLVGLGKAFDRDSPINAHALAYELTEHKRHFDRNQKAVRTLVKAGVAYGLIERHDVDGCNAKELRGTARLDSLMKRYAEEVNDIQANLATLLPEAI